MDDLSAMARALDALRPWLGHLVIIGGWAHHLHRYHPRAKRPDHEPVHTHDVDLAFSPATPLDGDMSAALQHAGFREELGRQFRPPATHYWLGEPGQGFSVEFLAPRRGGGFRRSGERDATLAKAGVTAQRLRYIDLLLTHPWPVLLDGPHDLPIGKPVQVLLVNPVSFVAQKLLIHRDRDVHKQAQDVLYIHDTLTLFPAADLLAEWNGHVRPTLSHRTQAEIGRIRKAKFDKVTDVIRAAARIPQDRMLTPDAMQATCAYGLERILGSD